MKIAIGKKTYELKWGTWVDFAVGLVCSFIGVALGCVFAVLTKNRTTPFVLMFALVFGLGLLWAEGENIKKFILKLNHRRKENGYTIQGRKEVYDKDCHHDIHR